MRAELLAVVLTLISAAGPPAPARAAERETAVPALPAVPSGLGASNAAPSLPAAPYFPAPGLEAPGLASPPALPASAILRTPAAGAAAPQESLLPRAAAPPPQVQARAVAEAASPLERAGVPREAAAALGELAADPTLFPKTDGPVLHDAKLARTLAELAAREAGPGATPRQRALLAAAAFLSTLDPSRVPGTAPRPSGTAEFLARDPRARKLLATLSALKFPGEPALDPASVAALARGEADDDDGRRLAFLKEAAPYLGQTIDAQKNLERLAAEQGVSAEAVNGTAYTRLAKLRASPYFAELPADARARFADTLTVVELFRTDAPAEPAAASSLPAGPAGEIRVLAKQPYRLRVRFDRGLRRMDATFMVTDEKGRRFALKTARYLGVDSGKDEKAWLSREAGYLREAAAVAARPGFPSNVKVARWLSYAELTPALARRVYGDDEPVPAMLLERAPGRTLQQHLNSGGRLDPRAFAGLVAAYDALHAAGLVHGDPNMGNILISEEHGRQVFTLLDFGAARTRGEVDADTFRAYVEDENEAVRGIAEFFKAQGGFR